MPSLKHQSPHRPRPRAGGKNHARRLDPVSQASCVVSSRRNCGKRQHQTQVTPQNLNRHYDSNQQYSITAVSDGGGSVVERYAYSAYGQVTIADVFGSHISDSGISNRYTYTGREWDEVLLLYHYRARMYDAMAGRFLSRDPIGYESESNGLYQYVRSNPLKYTDPDGNRWALITFDIDEYFLRVYTGRGYRDHLRGFGITGPRWGGCRPRKPENDLRPECVTLYRWQRQQCGQLYSSCYTQNCSGLYWQCRRDRCQKECDRAEACCTPSGKFQLAKCEGRAPRTVQGEAEHKRLGCNNEFGEPIPHISNKPYDPTLF